MKVEKMKQGNFESKLSEIEMTEFEHRREVQQKHYFDPEPIIKHKLKPKEQPERQRAYKREDFTTSEPRGSDAYDATEEDEYKTR